MALRSVGGFKRYLILGNVDWAYARNNLLKRLYVSTLKSPDREIKTRKHTVIIAIYFHNKRSKMIVFF